MFRLPNSSSHSPQSSFPDPFSVTSVISMLKSPSNISSLSPAAPSLFSLFCKKSAILTSSFSNPYALFKKDCFANFFTINHFPTLLPNTWGVPASSAQRLPIFSTGTPLRTHSNARNPFLFNRLLHSSLFTHIFLSLPFSPLHQRERRLPPNTETSCQFLPSCIDSSGTTPHLSKGGRSQKMSDEKSIQGGDRFPPTRWSVIDAARSSDEAERTRAMDTLCAAYWKPVYKYIRLRWNRPAEDAQDLTQGFFV